MKIGIDARLYGPEHTGLGRYVTNLIDLAIKEDKDNTYILFVTKNHLKDFRPNNRLKIVEVNIPIYGFLEQIVLPFYYLKQDLDLLHIPHFNAPIFYFKKTVITIHDLIKHESVGPQTTTRSPLLYNFKRLGYLFLIKIVVKKASKIIVPSAYVKSDLSSKLRLHPEKIVVTHEAAVGNLSQINLSKTEKNQTLNKFNLLQPFLIYTGNIYPHKNIQTLIEAVKKHNELKEVDLNLAIVCARSVFWDRLERSIKDQGLSDSVKLLGFVDDKDLSKLYSLALALVHPSKMEGFGLTGLEAMSVGLPVISSKATSLPEVYGNACLYFDPQNTQELVDKIEILIKDSSLREKLSKAGFAQALKYSWKKMVKETIQVYKAVLTK